LPRAPRASRIIDFYSRQDHWLRDHDHNHLRISRIIRSLGLLKSEEAVIEERGEAASNPVNRDSRGYWIRALVV
jgi:hypothetical protein